MDALDARVRRRGERRDFFRSVLGTAAVGAGAMVMASQVQAQSVAITDADILNFALNLEYLEAQFYLFAATGEGLAANLQTGTQTQGAVTGARRANLTDRAVIQYAREIAEDERAHVIALRSVLNGTSGNNAVAQPAINLSPAVFTAAAVAAQIDLSASAGVFDPYANDDNFLLAAFLFEDVGVTAYKGGAPLIASADIVDAAAGILAAEAYHAGIIRGALYRRGATVPALRRNADLISDARDLLDGNVASGGPPQRVADADQGISPLVVSIGNGNESSTVTTANIVPTDANGITFSRTAEQVHNIAYLTRNAATSGGFFPNGTNNANPTLRRSGQN
jgi:hypothetical protein